ncbi:MAG: hypothetical protein RL325_1399 [Planctomycetota bacterium]|jgi:hypothetical protein
MKSLLKLVLVLAIAHLLAVAGFVGWLFASGRVDSERIGRMREIFAKPVAVEAKEAVEAQAKADEQAADAEMMRKLRELPLASADRVDNGSRSDERIELGLRAFEDKTRRLREELKKDGDTLEQQIKAFEKRQKDWEASIAADKQRETDEQFRKAVRLVESMPPKQARSWILELVNSGKTETAVAYLDAMTGAKASNLLKSFKGDEEVKVATELLERLRMLGLESEARAERTHGAKPADIPAETARTEANPGGGGAPAGPRAPAANRPLELPGGAGGRGASANAER